MEQMIWIDEAGQPVFPELPAWYVTVPFAVLAWAAVIAWLLTAGV